jgi:hypothetical protein
MREGGLSFFFLQRWSGMGLIALKVTGWAKAFAFNYIQSGAELLLLEPT